jgi:RecB family exonuclease
VITPRRTRLVRAPGLASFRTTFTDWLLALDAEATADTLVIVPTRAAAEQLRRTVEDRALAAGRPAIFWPTLAPRRELYDELAARLTESLSMLSAHEREVLLSAAARELEDHGIAPPFNIRPSLVAEMVALYDQIRRLGRSVDDFARNFRAQLEPEQDIDRGAARLLQQTIFLEELFRRYEARRDALQRADEHTVRAELLRRAPARPLRRILVTVADRIADPDGLWPADFDLLARLPELQQIDVLTTEAVLAAGFLERLHAALPDIEEERARPSSQSMPTLVVPPASHDREHVLVSTHRDREDELVDVARRLKAERRAVLGESPARSALFVRRPLPYLYVARHVFTDAGVAFEALDTFPLAAEPYAAAVDLVLDAVASDFTRASLLALLRSPHFDFAWHAPEPLNGSTAEAAVIAACDFALSEARYLGGLDRLDELIGQWASIGAPAHRDERRRKLALPALTAVAAAARSVASLAAERRVVDQLSTLIDWLTHFDRPVPLDDPTRARRLRVRPAVIGAMTSLRVAYERHDPDARADVAPVAAAIRRWLESQTFAAQSGEPGLQIVDAQAARYGDFDDVQIVGLVDGEWPERPRRNVLYPSSLLTLLEPLPAVADPGRRDQEAMQGARAAFKDLVCSSARTVRLSAFTLEQDSVVEPSMLIDDVPAYGLAMREEERFPGRVSWSEALALDPREGTAVPPPAHEWAAARLARDDRGLRAYRGDAGPWRLPRVSVSRLERYLDCPFRFFASEVLRLEEQPEDEDTRTPLERGRFLHELWERFFSRWQEQGGGRIEPQRVDDARALFEGLCEEALASLPPSEAALERNRLLGSAVGPGIAHRVFAMEADRATSITERLLEYPLQGDFTFRRADGTTRTVTLSAKTDRIDVLSDGTLRVIDYKSKKTPDPKQALQLPIYSYVAREALRAARGGAWAIGEALYLSFEGEKAVVPLRARGRTLDELLDDAQERLVATLDRIAEGQFPATPAHKSLCGPCPYRVVCRLELVEPAVEDADE